MRIYSHTVCKSLVTGTSVLFSISAFANQDMKSSPPFAVAQLEAKSGSSTQGKVELFKVGDQIMVKADLTGVTPAGEHGFHIHENGDCSAEDAKSAGGHFNPENVKHGEANSAKSHMGDLGNIKADSSGRVKVTKELLAKPTSEKDALNWSMVIGKAIIVHAGRDDLRSQPSGDAGSRIACGVIKAI